jgi:hypothetical protein
MVTFDMGFKDIHMNALYPGEKGRSLFAMHPPVMWRTNVVPLRTQRPSGVILRQKGDAWRHPFVAIYEPFGNGAKSVVHTAHIEANEPMDDFVAVRVVSEQGSDLVLNATGNHALHHTGDVSFRGFYAVVSSRAKGETSIYLGSGRELSTGRMGIRFAEGEHTAMVTLHQELDAPLSVDYACETGFELTFPASEKGAAPRSFVVTTAGGEQTVQAVVQGTYIVLSVPPSLDGKIREQ